MARISTYPLDTVVVGSDKWIGSDSQNFYATKNFTADAVAEFINGDNKVEAFSLRYRYEDLDVPPGRQAGTISFPATVGSNVYFNTVNSFMISEFQLNRPLDSLENFYTTPLIGSMVMISQCDKISNWGVFNWNNSAVDPVESKFFDITLQYVSGPGYFEDDADYFITILQYDVALSNDKNYVWTQAVPSLEWQVTHNLDKYCSVEVVDDNGVVVYPNIDYISLNTVIITFSTHQAGFAYFN